MSYFINKRSYLLFLFLIVVVSACKVGKKYQRPELALPKQFSTVSFSDTSSIADIEWKKFFGDTVLQHLIEKGLRYNYDMLMSIKRIEMAERQAKQSRFLQLPELNFLLGAQVSRPSDNSLAGLSLRNFLGKS